MKKQTMYCSIGLLILVTGLLALRFWYDSKCVKFRIKIWKYRRFIFWIQEEEVC